LEDENSMDEESGNPTIEKQLEVLGFLIMEI
jgi:hypothetical protein